MRNFKKICVLILIVLIVLVTIIFMPKNSKIKNEKKKNFNYNYTWEQLFSDPVYRQMILYQVLVSKTSPEYSMRDIKGNHVITNATIANISVKEKQQVTEAELASITELFPLTPENEKDNINYIPIAVKSWRPFFNNCYLYNLNSIEINIENNSGVDLIPYRNYSKCYNLKNLKVNNYGVTRIDLGRSDVLENFEINNHTNDYSTTIVINNNAGYLNYSQVKVIKGKGNFILHTEVGTIEYPEFTYHTNMNLDKFIIDGSTNDVVPAKETIAKTTQERINIYMNKNPCSYTLSGDDLGEISFSWKRTESCSEDSVFKVRNVPKLKRLEITYNADFNKFDFEDNNIENVKISSTREAFNRNISLKNNNLKRISFDHTTLESEFSKFFKELNVTVEYGQKIEWEHSTWGHKKAKVIVDDSNKEEYTEEEVNNLIPKSNVEGINGVFLSTQYNSDSKYTFLDLGLKTLKVVEANIADNTYKVAGIIKVEVLKTSMASNFEPQYITTYPKKFAYFKDSQYPYTCNQLVDNQIPIINRENISIVEDCAKNQKGLHNDGYRKITFKDGSVKYFPLEYYGYEFVDKIVDCKDLYTKDEKYIYGDNNKILVRKYKKVYHHDCIFNNENYTCTTMYKDNCDNYKLENTLLDSKNYQKVIMKVEELIPWGQERILEKLREEAVDTATGIINIHSFEPGKTIMESNDYLYNETTQTAIKNLDWKEDEDKRVIYFVSYEDNKDGTRTKEKDRFVVTTILRDTDRDGIPDEEDEDDDNDGISDEQEKIDGTDSKDKNSYKVNICHKITG